MFLAVALAILGSIINIGKYKKPFTNWKTIEKAGSKLVRDFECGIDMDEEVMIDEKLNPYTYFLVSDFGKDLKNKVIKEVIILVCTQSLFQWVLQ